MNSDTHTQLILKWLPPYFVITKTEMIFTTGTSLVITRLCGLWWPILERVSVNEETDGFRWSTSDGRRRFQSQIVHGQDVRHFTYASRLFSACRVLHKKYSTKHRGTTSQPKRFLTNRRYVWNVRRRFHCDNTYLSYVTNNENRWKQVTKQSRHAGLTTFTAFTCMVVINCMDPNHKKAKPRL